MQQASSWMKGNRMEEKKVCGDLQQLKAAVDQVNALHRKAYTRVGQLVDSCADPKKIAAAHIESQRTAKAWSDAVTAYNNALDKLSDS